MLIEFKLNNCTLKKIKIFLQLHLQVKILWGMIKKLFLKRKRELNDSFELEHSWLAKFFSDSFVFGIP